MRNSNTVFPTTAARNQQLAETFVALPTFQIESRALLRRLDTFADVANPVIKQLTPIATAFGPVFENLEELAPDLRDFVVDLGPTISASVKGVPGGELVPAVFRAVHRRARPGADAAQPAAPVRRRLQGAS